MGCKSCFEKRVSMYVARGMSRRDAEKQAEKIMPLIEKAVVNRKPLKGNPTDYSLNCVQGSCHCDVGAGCVSAADCRTDIDCCACPAPLPNSHQIANNCSNFMTGCLCVRYKCSGTCTCYCSGTCDYDCDEGREWNPITEQCEPIAVPPAKPLINKPLVNPILVNTPIIRLLKMAKTLMPQRTKYIVGFTCPKKQLRL